MAQRILIKGVLVVVALCFLGTLNTARAEPPCPVDDPVCNEGSPDAVAPQITGYTGGPSVIDTSTGDKYLDFTIPVTDDKSGATWVYVLFRSPSGSSARGAVANLTSGTSLNGTWTGQVFFQQYSEQGTWNLECIRVQDRVGNQRSYCGSDLTDIGVSASVNQVGADDLVAPTLTGFSMSQSIVDSSTGDRNVPVQISAADGMSGVNWVYALFRSTSGSARAVVGSLQSGTVLNGVWSGDLFFPQYGEQGEFTLECIRVQDRAGNESSYCGNQLDALGISATVRQVGPADLLSPHATGVTITPTAINTTSSDQYVTLLIPATDELAGVNWVYAFFRSPSGASARAGVGTLTSGTTLDGTWTLQVLFEQFSEVGHWKLECIRVQDRVGHERAYCGSQLADIGGDTEIEVTPPPGKPDLKITKTAAPTNARPGDVVTYTLKAENVGNAVAHNVQITDPVPVGMTFVSADSPCTESGGTVNCAIGDLAPGQVKTYTVKATVDAWGDADPSADHLLDVQKVETQIDLNPGEVKTVQAVCPSGYFASDGSVRIDHVDQGTGDWTAPEVLESRASSLESWQGTVRNTASGRAQAKIFAVCISKQTVADGGHQHDLIVSNPITVTNVTPAGKNEATLQCGPGQIAIQPGFNSSVPADLVYSEPEGNGWKFVLDTKVDGQATFSIRCMTRQVSVVDGHTHDLQFQHIVKEFSFPAGQVSEAQLTCADGYKGIVADMDLDDGLVSLGNDPRPVTRAFKIYNPTDHDLTGRLSLLCLGLRTAGEHVPPKVLQNTAYISTSSFEEVTTNNHSTATVTAEDTDNYEPVEPTDPVKPTPNNPVAKTIVGKGVSYSASGVTFTLKCSGSCGGTAKLSSLKKVKVKGNTYRRGTVLAKKQYFIGKAGTKRIKLTLTRAGKGILKSGKVRKAALRISGDLLGRVQIK